MGGNAFKTALPNATFPRLPTASYLPLKLHLTELLKQFYTQVTVPREAPEKIDHGDLDFVVCGPCEGLAHEQIKHAMGASHGISFEGSRGMHQFAIPLPPADLKHAVSSPDEAVFFQVDVLVCGDVEEWNRVVHYNSYGDLGMILGSIAHGVGLSLGRGGLKVRTSIFTAY